MKTLKKIFKTLKDRKKERKIDSVVLLCSTGFGQQASSGRTKVADGRISIGKGSVTTVSVCFMIPTPTRVLLGSISVEEVANRTSLLKQITSYPSVNIYHNTNKNGRKMKEKEILI